MEPTQKLKEAVKAYREGRTEAFTPLYEESSKYIYTCIYKVMGNNDNAQDIISDIMQDTYIEISKSIGQLGDSEKFLSWAGMIATRKCFAYLKKNKKYVLLDEEDDIFDNLSDNDNIIPEEVMQSREKQRIVREIIDTQLSEIQKLCIIAYYYNEQKQSEIAREFGISENTVKTNLARAKAKIRDGVLDIEKKQDIKLYSVAPLLLFLLDEEVAVCSIPAPVIGKVNVAISTVKGTGAKTLWGKIAAASLKAKITAGIIGAVALIAVGSAVYMTEPNQSEPEENVFGETLPEDGSAAEVDLNDFDTESTDSQMEEVSGEEEEVTLSDTEEKALEKMAELTALSDYFLGNPMQGVFYDSSDIKMDMRFIEMASLFGMEGENDYAAYLPPMEADEYTYMRYFAVEDIQSYLKNVFQVENADLTAYMENGRVACSLVGEPVTTKVSIEKVTAMPDSTLEVSGTFMISEVLAPWKEFPFLLRVTQNEESLFGYTMESFYYEEGAY